MIQFMGSTGDLIRMACVVGAVVFLLFLIFGKGSNGSGKGSGSSSNNSSSSSTQTSNKGGGIAG